jgi:predicted TIM-barrel fold metal-dependent hydrolase
VAITADAESATSERYLVISGDGHAGPPELKGYREHMEKKFLPQFDDYVDSFPQRDAFMGLVPEELRPYLTEGSDSECSFEPSARIATLEAEGIVAEVVFPPHPAAFAPLGLNIKGDRELQVAGARMQNRWMAEFCSANPGRFAGVAMTPLRADVDAAVAEVQWASDAGLRGALIPTPSLLWTDYPGYWDPVYDPFWSACESLNMPVIYHPGLMGGFSDTNGVGVGGIMAMSMDFTLVPRRLLSQLIFGGVFERHPRLKLVLSEIFADWVPSTLRDLDKMALGRSYRDQMKELLSLTPREYFARHVFVTASFMSQWEFEHRDEIGVDKTIWGADFPHLEGTWPETREYFRMAAAGVPPEDMRRILGGNALECFDSFDERELRAHADKVGPTVDELSIPLEQVPDTLHGRYSTSFEPRA